MPQVLQCPECEAHLDLPPIATKQMVQCSRCRHVFAPMQPKLILEQAPQEAPVGQDVPWEMVPSLLRPARLQGVMLGRIVVGMLLVSMLAYGAQLCLRIEHLRLLAEPMPFRAEDVILDGDAPLIARWEHWQEYSLHAKIFHHAAFWPTSLMFLIWLNQACWNVRRLDAEGMIIRPAEAAISFFLPVSNLIKPCLALQELLRASDPVLVRSSKSWQNATASPMIICWWICLLASFSLYLLARCISPGELAPAEDQSVMPSLVHLIRFIIILVEGTLLIFIIRGIMQRQRDRFDHLLDLAMRSEANYG